MGRYGSKSCMNPSVSCIHQWRVFSFKSSIPGFVQGGELVTVRATEMVKGMPKQSTRELVAEPVIREVEGFEIRHP